MPLKFDPPLLNSASPWASTKEDLQALYDCPYTGAVTVRTSLLQGFEENPNFHQHVLFDINDGCTHPRSSNEGLKPAITSLNTLGYSPTKTSTYLQWIHEIIYSTSNAQQEPATSQTNAPVKQKKPFIISITGAPEEVVENYSYICNWAEAYDVQLLVEINLSCPNIQGQPPPAYDGKALSRYFEGLERYVDVTRQGRVGALRLGIKIPPYTHQSEFDTLKDTLYDSARRRQDMHEDRPIISFITATNTLGGCLILDQETDHPALSSSSGTGIGGLAGAALHPIALGTVKALRNMLERDDIFWQIDIIGVGGVSDSASYGRMRSVGAGAVAVGTALGARGLNVFGEIAKEAAN
ncbi:MAG: dihydroorotate dehydrogenase [Candelina submexicana]|nr:MAG: dihydroorotate dehydrogenase [Candelina submexicana]